MARFLKAGDKSLTWFLMNAVRVYLEKKRMNTTFTFYRDGSKLIFRESGKRHDGKTTFEISQLIIPETLQPDWDKGAMAVGAALKHFGFKDSERWDATHTYL